MSRWSEALYAGDPGLRGRHAVPIAALLFGLFARLALLAVSHGNADSRSFEDAARAGNAGLYIGITPFNYAPGWAYVLFGIGQMVKLGALPFFVALGLLYLAADILTTTLIGLAQSVRSAALFFANPVSILASSFYLQFDTLSILFLVMALVAAGLPRKVLVGLVTAFLALSLLIKHVTWFHPLLFVRGRLRDGPIRILFPLVAYGIFAVAFVPYWRFWSGIKAQVIDYHSVSTDFGLAFLGLSFKVREAVFVVVVLGAVWLLRSVELRRASLMTFLVILMFMPGVWDYYFLWPIALGALCGGGVGYAVYSLVVTLFMLGSPDGLGLQARFHHLPDWSGLWWATCFWLCWEIRRLRKGSVEEPDARRTPRIERRTAESFAAIGRQ